MIFYFLTLLFLSGCTVGPKYTPPSPCVPENWKAREEEVENACELSTFWDLFDDKELNALEEKALLANPSLQIAIAKVEEGWAIAGITRANLFPDVSVNPQYQNTGTLFKLYLPSALTSSPALQGLPGDFRIHAFNYVLPFTMNYELDLWGKNRSLFDRSKELAKADEENYYVAMLRLTTDVASAYYYVKTLERQIDLLNELLNIKKEDLALSNERFERGLINQLSYLSAKEDLLETEIDLFDAEQKRVRFENTIAFLIGEPASDFSLEKSKFRPLPNPPQVPAGIPSTILQRRPDIRKAEHEMRASHYLINASYAELFPSFQLTGTLGFLSPEYKQFLGWLSRLWSFGGGINQPLFDGGARFSNIDASYANFTKSSWGYQETVLRAFQEVETALSDLQFVESKKLSNEALVEERRLSTKIASHNTQEGLTTPSDLNRYRKNLINGELQNAALLGAKYQATLELIKALGGSF